MYRVLIVEDDPMVAMLNEEFIKKNKNYHVVGKCRDGKSAIEFLKENSVDLIILDVYMPVTDGFEALRQIRRLQISTDVIMVTAANDKISLEEALHLGAVDYLVKPFTFERFQMALDKFSMQKEILGDMEELNQKNIDFIIDTARKKGEMLRPKGIQEKTLQIIMEYLHRKEKSNFMGDEIAEDTGFTIVTIRRYMSYLEEIGVVSSEMNYETGGRPCVVYHNLLTKNNIKDF